MLQTFEYRSTNIKMSILKNLSLFYIVSVNKERRCFPRKNLVFIHYKFFKQILVSNIFAFISTRRLEEVKI